MWAYQIYDETISGAADDDGNETATEQPDDWLPAGNTRTLEDLGARGWH
jgi:hypothetical protein